MGSCPFFAVVVVILLFLLMCLEKKKLQIQMWNNVLPPICDNRTQLPFISIDYLCTFFFSFAVIFCFLWFFFSSLKLCFRFNRFASSKVFVYECGIILFFFLSCILSMFLLLVCRIELNMHLSGVIHNHIDILGKKIIN